MRDVLDEMRVYRVIEINFEVRKYCKRRSWHVESCQM